MLLINTIAIIVISLNLAGLTYLLLIWVRNLTGKYNKNLSKIKIQSNTIKRKNIKEELYSETSNTKKKDDLLDDLELSDFDDLNLDDFD